MVAKEECYFNRFYSRKYIYFSVLQTIYLGRHNFKKLLTQIKQTSNLKVVAGTALGTKGQLGVKKKKSRNWKI